MSSDQVESRAFLQSARVNADGSGYLKLKTL